MTIPDIQILDMQVTDWPVVQSIYQQGIETGHATFEQNAPNWPQWDAAHHAAPRLVATHVDKVIGWAALSPVSARDVYRGVAEVSLYVHTDWQGKGVGSQLLARLVNESEQHNFWTLQAGIFPENKASIHLHKKHGFRIVGTRKRVGYMQGRWRDVVFMERRSHIVGV